jgi:hypothetical protein
MPTFEHQAVVDMFRDRPTLAIDLLKLLVITPKANVARWADEPIDMGFGSGSLKVHVLGPSRTPRIIEVEQARKAPELAVLSAFAAHALLPNVVFDR